MPRDRDLATVTGAAALCFSVLYFASDVVEATQGGFSDWQLVLTLIAEAAVPFFVWGLYRCQLPRIGRLGLWSAVVYALVYVAFTGTVIYALVDSSPDYDTSSDDLGLWLTVPGILMVVSGIGFGVAVVRAAVVAGVDRLAAGPRRGPRRRDPGRRRGRSADRGRRSRRGVRGHGRSLAREHPGPSPVGRCRLAGPARADVAGCRHAGVGTSARACRRPAAAAL